MVDFALIGAAGFVAPKHLKAIKETGNRLVTALDPHDSVGILDSYFPDVHFFTETERFDRHLEKIRRAGNGVQYVSVCSPNYLHDAHIRLALRSRAHAICEKPLVINPWNLDQLAELEAEHGCRVFTMLQLRAHPALIALKKTIEQENRKEKADVCLTYVTRRGRWYHSSWKGDEEKSGGLVMNIGIHFFDLLTWLFSSVEHSELYVKEPGKLSGYLELERAKVRWFLSTDSDDLPPEAIKQNKPAFRSITIDGKDLEFSDGFTDLHTKVYEGILGGRGYGISEARPSIELVHRLRKGETTASVKHPHPFLRQAK
jgi:UDP-N-acetyl-2-amino-2-deoxyglucuronate dehydrogenase